MLESKLAVAKVFPDGAHATGRTVFVCPVGIAELGVNTSFIGGGLLISGSRISDVSSDIGRV